MRKESVTLTSDDDGYLLANRVNTGVSVGTIAASTDSHWVADHLVGESLSGLGVVDRVYSIDHDGEHIHCEVVLCD